MADRDERAQVLNHSHWGTFSPVIDEGRLVGARPFTRDPDPSPLLDSIADAVTHRSRVTRPAVREGYLKAGPGRANEGRGGDRFIEVEWDRALGQKLNTTMLSPSRLSSSGRLSTVVKWSLMAALIRCSISS